MDIRGSKRNPIDYADVVRIVDQVSRDRYAGNIAVHPAAHAANSLQAKNGSGFIGRIQALDSRGVGARRSWSGRRTTSACWHVFRDVLVELFRIYPDARVRTGMGPDKILYNGVEGFSEKYPHTAYINIGSLFQPAVCRICANAVRRSAPGSTPPIWRRWNHLY